MPQTLRDFITQRETEIRSEIANMQSELRELEAARRAIDNPAGGNKLVPPSAGKITIKGMIRDVLSARPEGGMADEITQWVKSAFDVDVPRTSMSPQLSRLKSEGVVALDNSTNVWQLAEHASKRDLGFLSEENAPPGEGGADTGEADTSLIESEGQGLH